MPKLRKWFYTTTLFGFVLGLAQYQYNIFTILLKEDVTHIGTLILGVVIATSLVIGYKSYVGTEAWVDEHDNYYLWHISDNLLQYGLLGTLLGFLVILRMNFGDLDLSSLESTKLFQSAISKGLSTAMLTTIAAIVGQQFLSLQIKVLEEDER